MTKRQNMILFGLSGLTLLTVVWSVCLNSANRSAQMALAERQQFISQTVQLSNLNQGLIQALAQLSVQRNDADMRQLLARQGISFQVPPANAPKQPQAAPAAQGDAQ